MTLRDALLPAAGVLVLGMGVYLLVQVRASTSVSTPSPARSEPAAERAVPHVAAARPAAPPPAPAPPPPRETVRAQPEPPRPVSRPALAAGASAGTAADDGELIGSKLDAAMTEANTAYDQTDYEEARQLASRVLAKYPTNVRMLRIMVSAACIQGDAAAALANYARLPLPDQAQMKIRCARYGFSFPEKP